MAVYIRQTFVQAMEDASFCLQSSLHILSLSLSHSVSLTGETGKFAHLCLFPDFVCAVCLSEA